MILGLLAASSAPHLSIGNPEIWSGLGSTTRSSTAGEDVSPKTAMGLAAYFACIRVLSEDEAKLPLLIYRGDRYGKKELVTDIPAHRLLNSVPNGNATYFTLRAHLVSQCAGRGNGFWEIQRTGDGQPYAFHPLQTDQMTPKLHADGSVYWELMTGNGDIRQLESDDLIHLCGPSENGLVGWSIAYWATECIGSGLAQQRFAAGFFGNNAWVGGVLQTPQKLSDKAYKRIISNWNAEHRGPARSWGTALLEEDLKWQQTTVNPRDAEMIESRRFTIEEVCRWFRMPPGKIQHYTQAKGWDTTEAENLHYLTDTLQPWLERVEAEVDRKLFDGTEYFCEHDCRRLLRADAKGRAEYYTRMQEHGNLTINEICAMENMNGIGPKGDVRFVPSNLQTLERAIAGPPEPPPASPPEGGDDEDDDDQEESRDTERARAWLAHAAARILRKEAKAVARLAEKAKGTDAFAKAVALFFAPMPDEMAEEFAPAFACSTVPPELVALCTGFCMRARAAYTDPATAADISRDRSERLPKVWAAQVTALAESVGTDAAD